MVAGLLLSGCWVVYSMVAGLLVGGCGPLSRWPIYLRKFRIVNTIVSETRPTQLSMMIYIHYNRVTFDP